MGADVRLARADVDAALGVVADAVRGRDNTPFPRQVIEQVVRLLGADGGGYFEYEPGVRPNFHEVALPPIEFSWDDHPEFSEAIHSWPLRDPRDLRVPAVRSVSDSFTRRQRLQNPFHQVFYRPRGLHDEIKLWLPAPIPQVRGFFFLRGGTSRDFGAREHNVLSVLGPHLAAARERWEARRPPAGLTAREAEVLALVAAGLRNREIAYRLDISTGTVRTHLDHVYAKLGVHTRTAAAANFRTGRRDTHTLTYD